MKIVIKNLAGKNSGELEVKFALVENGKGTQAVHDTVVAHNAAQRSGTACTKTVGDVQGSNKKPWKQKGTGRARAGSFRSPLWAGGGVVFGPRPRDFSKKISKKTRALALRKALSERLKLGDVIVVDDLKLTSAKTKDFVKVIDGHHALHFLRRGKRESHAGRAQHRRRHADHERFAQHLRCVAPGQARLHQ